MSFKLENFGADASNVKSILGGANYYRYFNKDNNTLTTPGYFPADLGLAVGDRITVIPSTKTDADELYIVTSTANRTVTVTQIDTDGAVNSVNGKTGHVVLSASDVGATTSVSDSITLLSTDWSSQTYVATVQGVTSSNTVIVSPAPSSSDDYVAAGIKCTAQAENSLTFTCTTDPTNNISVNVVILN